MTEPTFPAQAQRRHWLAVLARASTAALERCVQDLGPLPAGETVRAPETGMVMLRGRAGGTGNAFNLGEATVTRCALRVGAALGVGYTLGRDARKAERIALLDALLQDEARRDALLAAVVDPLARQQAQDRAREAAATESSRVEFFTLVRGEA